jgi:hypothetical protein
VNWWASFVGPWGAGPVWINELSAPGKTPADYKIEATLESSGLQVASSSYVVVKNLISEWHSNDGFNIHGDCRGIVLENVVARHNGDDGISIHETGGLVVRGAHVHHNTFGLQDVNAARSFYNGVRAEHNHVGASFHGGFYSLVDCQLRDNTAYQIDIVAASPKHLVGSDHNPICRTTLFAGNVVVSGKNSQAGLRIGDGARAVVEHSVFTGAKTGILVHKGGFCHVTTSVVVDCECALASDSTDVFRDYNVYHPARMRWLGVAYGPDQWQAFRQLASHDEHSKNGPVHVAEDGTVSFPDGSPAKEIEKRVGPTAPVVITDLPPKG